MNLVRSFGFIGLAAMLLTTGCKEGEADMPKPEPKPVEETQNLEGSEMLYIVPVVEKNSLRADGKVTLGGQDYDTWIDEQGRIIPIITTKNSCLHYGFDEKREYSAGYIYGFGMIPKRELVDASVNFFLNKHSYLHSLSIYDSDGNVICSHNKSIYSLKDDDVYVYRCNLSAHKFSGNVVFVKANYELHPKKPANGVINMTIHYPTISGADARAKEFYVETDFPILDLLMINQEMHLIGDISDHDHAEMNNQPLDLIAYRLDMPSGGYESVGNWSPPANDDENGLRKKIENWKRETGHVFYNQEGGFEMMLGSGVYKEYPTEVHSAKYSDVVYKIKVVNQWFPVYIGNLRY